MLITGRKLTSKFRHLPRLKTAAIFSTAERMRSPLEAEHHEKKYTRFSDVINNEIRSAPEANERDERNLSGAIGEQKVYCTILHSPFLVASPVLKTLPTTVQRNRNTQYIVLEQNQKPIFHHHGPLPSCRSPREGHRPYR